MKADLVKRLRTWAFATDAVPASDLMDEAADEIARLRSLRDEDAATVSACVSDYQKCRDLCANGRYLTNEEGAALARATLHCLAANEKTVALIVQGIEERYRCPS